MSETYEVTLAALTYGGGAIGRLPDARAVFVPFGLPGERIRLRLMEQKRGFTRGEILEILQPAPERIAPRCRHFGRCGGCHYQHMPYDMQLKAKAEILREQLHRIGKIQEPPVQPAVASAHPWNYRNRVQFHLDEHGRLGFQAAASDQVVPISECHLPAPAIGALWPQLELEAQSGVARLALRAGMHDELMLVLESESPETPELEIEADVSVAHRYQDKTVILAGSDHITMQVLSRSFRVSPASFFQVNTDMAGRMVQHVLRRLPEALAAALDVYCGVGLFSAFLAPRCKRLIGIESSAPACADFMVNLDEFSNVELYEDLAEHALPALSVEPELMLVDPPRAGLTARALDAIVQMHPGRIAYVSCDPSTLARDARRLIDAGLRLADVTPFDLFPQTYHIESISFFES